jgi:hypothetical protein
MVALLCVRGEMREARAEEYCQQMGTDDALRAIATSLVPVAVRLLRLGAMPAEDLDHGASAPQSRP